MTLQEALYRRVWASAIGSSIGYAPFVTRMPLDGNPEKRVLLAFPNDDAKRVTSTLIRAADIASTSVFFRSDYFFADHPELSAFDPHDFAVASANANPDIRAVALGSQAMIAKFLATDGSQLIHPPGVPERYFEVPIALPLP